MILKGVLNGMADGHCLPGYTERAYIKVNEKRYKRISTTSILDNILIENVGNEVELSLTHSALLGNEICAIKESNGEVSKISVGFMILMNILRFCLYLLVDLAANGFVFLICFLSDIDYDGILRHIHLLVFILPILALIKEIKARHALK